MNTKSEAELGAAFAADGFVVDRVEHYGPSRGMLARSSADRARRALYLEGDPFSQGYLTGLLAAEEVERMAGEFVDNVVPAFVSGRSHPLRMARLKRRLLDILRDRCVSTFYRHPEDIPPDLREELRGLVAGCRKRDPGTTVTYRELFLLNTGIDFLLSYLYTGARRFDWIPDIRRFAEAARGRAGLTRRLALALAPRRPPPASFRVPLGCNAFSIGSRLTEGGRHYFGRDFMFPTAGVFQDTCCMFIRLPPAPALPTLALSAPGLVGSVTAMSAGGLGVGVNMVPGSSCDFRRPGLNSLLLVRRCAERAGSLEEAVSLILDAPRGVSWLYVVADGRRDAAAVVEAGSRGARLPDLESIPEPYRTLVSRRTHAPTHSGAMVRRAGWVPQCADDLEAANRELFAAARVPYRPECARPGGRFHSGGEAPWRRHALPGSFHFPPARIEGTDLLVAGNQYLTPQMRLTSMGAWVSLLAGPHEDDFQWRSDELSSRLLRAAEAARSQGRLISLGEAKALLDFLSPLRSWPAYYERSPLDVRGRRIEGALSLCDLTAGVMHSYFGAYDELWVRLTLPAYLAE